MSSSNKRSSLGLALGISLGLACSAGVVHAGSIGDTYATGSTLTAAKMDNIKAAVNDNDARITTNTNDITSLTTTVDGHTTSITGLTTTVGGNTTSINALTTTVNGHTTSISGLTTTVNGHTTSISGLTTNVTNLQADVTNLQTGSGSCSGNNASDVMVRIGSICVDKYEASLWPDKTSAGTTPTLANTCAANGSDCTYVAQSRAGVTPTSSISWMQATQACANAGKRLLRPAEWFMAAAGTDPANCNINGASAAVANTGAYATCVSRHTSNAVADMSGNLAEFIDYAQVDNITPSASGIPYAGYTGGKYDSVGATLVDRYYANFLITDINVTVGFRCTR